MRRCSTYSKQGPSQESHYSGRAYGLSYFLEMNGGKERGMEGRREGGRKGERGGSQGYRCVMRNVTSIDHVSRVIDQVSRVIDQVSRVIDHVRRVLHKAKLIQ